MENGVYQSSEVRAALNREVVKEGAKIILPGMIVGAIFIALPAILVPVLTRRLEWLALAGFPLLVGVGMGLKRAKDTFAAQCVLRTKLKQSKTIRYSDLFLKTAKQAWPSGLKKSE